MLFCKSALNALFLTFLSDLSAQYFQLFEKVFAGKKFGKGKNCSFTKPDMKIISKYAKKCQYFTKIC